MKEPGIIDGIVFALVVALCAGAASLLPNEKSAAVQAPTTSTRTLTASRSRFVSRRLLTRCVRVGLTGWP